jgi:NADH:ubiquinone oxidoreductase subunit 5 (subunit L)/multisubunit Na+/H+ antiporter MnhA subunit
MIKKSTLESKWYYRALKTILIILPLLVLIYLLLNQKANICSINHSDIFNFLLNNIVFVIFIIIIYYFLVWGIWRIILYVFFGGLEDDQKKKTDTQPVKEQKNIAVVRTICLIIIILAILLAVLSKTGVITLPQGGYDDWTNYNNNANMNILHPGPNCPATSKQTATPCHSVSGGVGVGGVIVKEPCKCPSDTKYSGTTDVITPGGPYLICTCK